VPLSNTKGGGKRENWSTILENVPGGGLAKPGGGLSGAPQRSDWIVWRNITQLCMTLIYTTF
jgi:hypothetical protein